MADGVGGHRCGAVASLLTCQVMQREIAAGSDLCAAINRANTDVLDAGQTGRGKEGMGSTVVAALLAQNSYELAWVGDSRIYLWDGKLHLLTRDHSLVETQRASGQISLEEARTHPRRHVILQAVGSPAMGNLDIGTNSGELASNTCLLLCSDGITDALDSAQLCQLLSHRTTADETCQRLVTMALQCGGRDNATAVLITHDGIPEDPPRSTAPAQVVWVYDPVTAIYEGLPDRALQNFNHTTEILQTPAQRVKPDAVSPGWPPGEASEAKTDTDRRAANWGDFCLVSLFGIIVLGLVLSVR